MKEYAERQYDIRTTAPFKKTTEKWGGLSNMSAGFSVVVAGVSIRSSEALYQACRFPHMPQVQEKIILQSSPMTAKMVGKPFREQSRSDWNKVRVQVMKWCLRVKLAQNWDNFSSLLLETEDLLIVELSNKDAFWGAKPVGDNIYVGVNALGRLLMGLRQQIISYDKSHFISVPPLKIDNFSLLENDIGIVNHDDKKPTEDPQLNLLDI